MRLHVLLEVEVGEFIALIEGKEFGEGSVRDDVGYSSEARRRPAARAGRWCRCRRDERRSAAAASPTVKMAAPEITFLRTTAAAAAAVRAGRRGVGRDRGGRRRRDPLQGRRPRLWLHATRTGLLCGACCRRGVGGGADPVCAEPGRRGGHARMNMA